MGTRRLQFLQQPWACIRRLASCRCSPQTVWSAGGDALPLAERDAHPSCRQRARNGGCSTALPTSRTIANKQEKPLLPQRAGEVLFCRITAKRRRSDPKRRPGVRFAGCGGRLPERPHDGQDGWYVGTRWRLPRPSGTRYRSGRCHGLSRTHQPVWFSAPQSCRRKDGTRTAEKAHAVQKANPFPLAQNGGFHRTAVSPIADGGMPGEGGFGGGNTRAAAALGRSVPKLCNSPRFREGGLTFLVSMISSM